MGYLTTVTFYNDAFDQIKKDAKNVIDKIIYFGLSGEHKTIGAGYYCNCVEVQKTRHSSDHTVYINYGNSLNELNPYSADFIKIIEQHPDVAKSMLKEAKDIIKMCEKVLKERTEC